MKKTNLLLIFTFLFGALRLCATPFPPFGFLVNVTASNSTGSNNQVCKGSVTQLQATVDPINTTFIPGYAGPNGGLVTLDKGDDNNGWRYLQLAPYDIVLPDSLIAGFGCDCQNVNSFNETPGGGYENFQAWLAAPCVSEWLNYIDTLHILGFDDWYIPSLDELNSVYNFITNQGAYYIEGFQDDFYWTSSAANFGSCGSSGGIYQKSMQSGNISTVDRNNPLGRIRLMRRFSNIPQYLWDNGSTESSIQISNSTEGNFTYSVQVSAYAAVYFINQSFIGTFPGSIGINVVPIIQTLNETITEGDSILFNGVYLKERGVFEDTLTDNSGCLVITQLNLEVRPLPLKCRIDVSYCAGDIQKLSLFVDPPISPGNQPSSIQWSTGATSPQITLEPNAAGTYSVTVSDDVQTCTASIQIQNP